MVKKIKNKKPNFAKEMKDAMEVFLKKRGMRSGWKHNGFNLTKVSNE